jgi:hypothetical protein
MAKRIKDSQAVRVIIHGIALQTTAKALNSGTISQTMRTAWETFLDGYAQGWTGHVGGFWNASENAFTTIQIDLV